MSKSNLRILFRLIERVYRVEGFTGVYRRLLALTNGQQLNHKKYEEIFSDLFIVNFNNYTNSLYNIKKKLRAWKQRIIIWKTKDNIFLHIDEGGDIFTSLFCNKGSIKGWAFKGGVIATPINLRLKINNEYVEFSRVSRPDVGINIGTELKDEKIGFEASYTLKKYFNIINIQNINNKNKWESSYTKILFNIANRNFFLKSKLNYGEVRKKRLAFVNEQISSINNHISLIDTNLHFEIYVKNVESYKELKITLDSLDAQIYKNFSIHINNDSLKKLDPNFLDKHKINPPQLKNLNVFWMAIPSGYVLELNALYEFFNAYIGDPQADVIYADEDYLIDGSHTNPFYKPDWSPDYLETFNYVGDMAIYRPGKVELKFLLKNNSYDFVLSYTELTNNILHVKKVLGGGAALPNKISFEDNEENIRALNERLKRTNRSGNAQVNPEFYGSYFFNINLRETPLVSIVIPTAGKVANLAGVDKDLICNVIEEIFSKSTYTNIEVIVVDGGELLPSQLEFIHKFGCRRIQHSNKKFNYSNSCNLGANIASGEILIFLNDDIEIITSSWIEGIVAQFEKPHVGVVGCRLLYPNGLLQHVGVVHNKGCPDHVMDGLDSGLSGYFYSVSGIRNYQAITGACQAVRKKIFFDVGGYSEDLAVCFNDTDLCLKIASRSKYIVYDGGISLVHMTSQSRSSSAPLNLEELNLYQDRWRYETIEDPFYNEKNLSILRPTFEPEVNLDTL
jgi:GT2 family glycosyltransferase